MQIEEIVNSWHGSCCLSWIVMIWKWLVFYSLKFWTSSTEHIFVQKLPSRSTFISIIVKTELKVYAIFLPILRCIIFNHSEASFGYSSTFDEISFLIFYLHFHTKRENGWKKIELFLYEMHRKRTERRDKICYTLLACNLLLITHSFWR